MFGALRTPRNIVFGIGQRASLPRYVTAFGQKVLIVTDQRMEGEASFRALHADLSAAGLNVSVFSEVEAELPTACLHAGIGAAREFGAQVIVGIGGGSCIDAAKVIALVTVHGGAVSDYYGEFKVPGPILPLVALPTTAGTGSEVTPVAVVADPDRAVKVGIASPYLIPDTAICDPELTVTCPPGLTAVSGADALVHAIEAFTTAPRAQTPGLIHEHVFIGKNALTDNYALAAVGNIGRNLQTAVRDGGNLEARASVMLGATQAGLAFGTAGTSVCHAVQYPVGALTHTAHGLGVALMLPYALAFNRGFALADIAAIGRILDFADEQSSDEVAADACISEIAALLRNVAIPHTLAEIGVKYDDLPWIAEQAMAANRLIKNNPRPVDREGMDLLVEAAFTGDLSMLSAKTTDAKTPDAKTPDAKAS
ncbi:iron-containing alcohol dehydrogenase [Devosia nitrariae]|uniref:Alcohol dehydrogenase n=1 Tax=Devosia nitrariae TaxID=2071872 RepID=A0ABQ5W6C3_9HYPH|nr:iron-containing alcohol dehydrogenase [Devosia nitrariae]GLQ55614.1 alcohol dehydrogenase [Devosia nitrariae]